MLDNKRCTEEDPHWLFSQYQQASNLLIIDCRPLSEYSKAHIEGAINISVPSLMLRRLKKGNVPLKNFINSEIAKEKFDERKQAEKIVLYDENSTMKNCEDNSIIDFMKNKMAEDNAVALLSGGFRRFEESFPHLCQCGEGTELVNSTMFCLQNLNLDSDIPSPLPLRDMNNNSPITLENSMNSKDLLFRPDSLGPIQIMPQLFLGNKHDASVLKLLQQSNITHILNVTHDLPNFYEDTFQYLQLPIQDNWDGNMMDLFPKAFAFIDNAIANGGNVLVHCLGGISRSSTVIIAYLMVTYNYSLNEAYDHVKSKKSNIAPNFNFMGQLLDFERSRCVLTPPFSTSPGSISPGSISTGSEASTSSIDSNDSC